MAKRKREMKFPAGLLVFYLLSLFFSGCGGGGSDSSSGTASPSAEVGSIQFNIAWENAPVSAFDSSAVGGGPSASLDCSATGVSTVEARVYDGSTLLVPPGQWSCGAHSGTIANIPAGSNRSLVILGKDSQGNNIYIGGPVAGITVQSDQTYNAGTITAIPYSVTLSAPANNSSVVTCNFGFQWSAPGAAKFQIQIDDNSDFSSPVSTPVLTQPSYTPSDLNPGKYYWRVRGDDGWGNLSPWSAAWNFTVVTGIGKPPAAPTGAAAAPGDSLVSITWNSVIGATGYNIYWSTTPGVTKTTGTKISGAASPFVHTGLTNGTVYYYVVTAVNSCGESSESNQASATPGSPPSVPTGVTAAAGDRQVTLNWSAVSAAASYNVYFSTSPGVTKATGTKIAGITSPAYTHTGLTNGTAYYYVVTAVNSYGESGDSSQVSATPGVPPPAPTGVSATPGDSQVTLGWSNVSGATYNIYWSTTSGVTKSTGTKISGATNPFTQTGLTNGTTYYYVVTAVNSYGESSDSAQVSATPTGNPPPAPTGVSATPGNKQVNISWNAVSGAVTYNVYWSTTPGVTKATGTKIPGITNTSYNQTGLTNGTAYYYVVTAVNSNGESGESAEVSATPQ